VHNNAVGILQYVATVGVIIIELWFKKNVQDSGLLVDLRHDPNT
jgi:hypothetical protein